MVQSLLPEPIQSYEDSNGKPLNGGKLYTYSAGTLTPKATYQDAAGTIPNSNPVILSERGEAVIYGTGNYRLILQNSAGATIFDRDNVSTPASSTGLAGPDGASQVGYDDSTLDVFLKSRLNRVVDSIVALRGLDKTKYTRAFVSGYYAAGDGGGGFYWYDSSDTTTADNGGTVIVATDGARWKLIVQQSVTVKQFGAKGDGTTDDTTFIQAAINAAAAAKVLLLIPFGTFIVSAALNLTTDSRIGGVGTIKLKDNCTPKPGDILRCNTATGVFLQDFTIDANRQNNVDHGTPDGSGNQATTWQGTLLAAIDYAYVSNFAIRNVTVKECWGSGVWITDCDAGLIEGNRIYNHRITGIAVRNNTADAREIKNIRVLGNHVEGGIVGIHCIFGAKDTVIDGNTCINNKDPNRFPAYAYSGAYPNVWPSTGGFTPFGSPGYVSPALQGDGAGIEATGVFTDPAGTANLSISVAGNTCNLNAVGIRLEETSNKFAIAGNTCRQNDFYGILALSAYFNTFTGNTCTQNNLDGIRLEKVTGKPQPANNIVSGNISTENKRFGLIILGGQGCTVQGNILSGNGADTALTESGAIGLYLVDGTAVIGTTIEGNQLQNTYATDKYGIYSSSASNVGNSIIGNQFSGSYVTSKTNLSTVNNTFAHNTNFKTESRGSASVIAGNLFVDAPHGLDITPLTGSVQVTPVNDYGTARWWLQAVDATNIRIQLSGTLAGNADFVWDIQ